MKYEVYRDINTTKDYSEFDFISVGKNGTIHKRIVFEPMQMKGIYSVALLDVDKNGSIRDDTIGNNGDRDKILASVAYTVEIYLGKYPERWVYFRGNTSGKTRLYRMAVGLNIDELVLKFDIYAEQVDGIVPFQKNVPLLGILGRKKI